MAEILTFGYQGLKMEKIVEAIVKRNAVVFDVRFSPYSPFPGWKKQSFQAALGDRYVWAKGFGNVNYKGGGVRLYDEASGLKLVAAVQKHAHTIQAIALMCACADVEHCHRKVVAYVVNNYLGWPIYHLQSVDIMGMAEPKPKSEATLKREAAKAAKAQQGSLFRDDEGKKKYHHRDDS